MEYDSKKTNQKKLSRNEILNNIKNCDLFNSKYDCKKCRKKLRYKADVIMHLKLIHAKKTETNQFIFCPICSNSFSTYYHLKFHLIKLHLNERPYSCRLCKKKFFTFLQLKKHCNKYHITTENDSKILLSNITLYSNSWINKLGQVNPQTKNGFVLREIISKQKLEKKDYVDPIKINSELSIKKQSFTIITEFNVNKCSNCFKFFKSHSEYLCHYWYEHLAKNNTLKLNFECWKCYIDHVYSNYNSLHHLIDHLSSAHFEEEAYKCSICHSGFNCVEEINKHFSKKHLFNSEKNSIFFSCHSCEQAFSTSESIEEHFYQNHEKNLNKNNSNELYFCLECNEIFYYMKNHEMHLCQHLYFKNVIEFGSIMAISQAILSNNNLDKTSKSEDFFFDYSKMPNSINRKKNFSRIDDIALKIISMRNRQSILKIDQNSIQIDAPKKTHSKVNNLFKKKINCNSEKNSIISSDFNKSQPVYFKSMQSRSENSTLSESNKTLLLNDSKNQLILNKINETKSFTLKCEFCGYLFENELRLTCHKSLHSSSNPKRPFKCHLCLVNFTKVEQLIRHMIVHQAREQDSICQICFSSFTRKQDLDRHMLFHSKYLISEKNKLY